jgi:hypothetical protein
MKLHDTNHCLTRFYRTAYTIGVAAVMYFCDCVGWGVRNFDDPDDSLITTSEDGLLSRSLCRFAIRRTGHWVRVFEDALIPCESLITCRSGTARSGF